MTARDLFFLIALVGGLALVGLGKLEGATLFAFIAGVLTPSPVDWRGKGAALPVSVACLAFLTWAGCSQDIQGQVGALRGMALDEVCIAWLGHGDATAEGAAPEAAVPIVGVLDGAGHLDCDLLDQTKHGVKIGVSLGRIGLGQVGRTAPGLMPLDERLQFVSLHPRGVA